MPQTKLFVLLITLYLAQGLPSGFIAHALPTILREQNVSLTLIGFLKLLALPWLLKFLWAPIIDKSVLLHGNEARRRWILCTQGMIAILLIGLSQTVGSPGAVFLLCSISMILVINICAATQDVVTDGVAVSMSSATQLGWINSVQVAGYKIGMIAGGSGLLILSAWFSWQWMFVVMAAILVTLLVPVLLLLPKSNAGQLVKPPKTGDEQNDFNTWQSIKGFFKQQYILPWILVLLSYKLSDGLGSSMLKPMLFDFGWSKSEIGTLLFQSSVVGLIGAATSGLLYRWFGQFRGLLVFAILQACSVSAFYFISIDALSLLEVKLLVCIEQFCDGLSTVALFAAMMAHCRPAHEGSDYTVQASTQILLAGLLGAVSGVLADQLGYSALYWVCAVFGIVSIVSVVFYGVKARPPIYGKQVKEL